MRNSRVTRFVFCFQVCWSALFLFSEKRHSGLSVLLIQFCSLCRTNCNMQNQFVVFSLFARLESGDIHDSLLSVRTLLSLHSTLRVFSIAFAIKFISNFQGIRHVAVSLLVGYCTGNKTIFLNLVLKLTNHLTWPDFLRFRW